VIELNKIIHADCMDIMKDIPDKYFELAIVDPPYGMNMKMDGTSGAGRIMRKWKRENVECWDYSPDENYFKELERISKNRIIWGANNFIKYLDNTTNFIFWYKHQPAPNFADGELAWTSFNGVCKCFSFPCFGAHGQDKGGKIHPTQKPVALYRWLLQNYAKPGDKIIDTHSGSGSCAIACHLEKFDFLAIEKDKNYFDASVKRFNEIKQQYTFNFPDVIPEIESHQGILL